MRLKNVLIVVKDIEISKAFYRDLFGLHVLTDFGKNVILTEGLVLQEKTLWEESIGEKVVSGGNEMELYFEENNLDAFVEMLEASQYEIKYVNYLQEQRAGRKVVRFYDPDMHVIEVGEPFGVRLNSQTAYYGDTGIKQSVIDEIIVLAQKYGVDKLILFGSRARGDYHLKSDIDLAFSGGNASAFIVDVNEETSTLLKYDIVDLLKPVQKELLESIEREGVIIYEKI